MTIEYMTDRDRLQVEHVEDSDVHRWAAEHPLAIILHAIPDHERSTGLLQVALRGELADVRHCGAGRRPRSEGPRWHVDADDVLPAPAG